MKKLTKMSLEKLAKTMSVIPEDEMDMYWGMYDNDCFWRCIAYLNGAGISEEAAASYATNYFASHFSGSEVERIAQATSYLVQNGAEMTNIQMLNYSYNGTEGYFIRGFAPDVLSNYGFTGDQNHIVVFESPNPSGGVNLYCPQTDTHFTMSIEDYAERIF